jgi:hypothetical protein
MERGFRDSVSGFEIEVASYSMSPSSSSPAVCGVALS